MCQHLSETIKIVRATYLLLILKISETKTASLYKEKEDDRERERERERGTLLASYHANRISVFGSLNKLLKIYRDSEGEFKSFQLSQ